MSEAAPTLRPGARVGEYEVLGVLGKGGMGTVYSGVHPKIGKKVAIKVLNPEMAGSEDVIARFVQEARSVNQIGHKHIIDIFAFGDLPDQTGHYFVMERLEGESLAARIARETRLSGALAIEILEQVAQAIDAAHAEGIWHRDLKPDNVYLVPDRERPHVKVLDFGIAKLTDGAVAAKTRTGVPMGTPMFMSPEQWKGRDVDHRTDIYALGVMAFVMLTGNHPFMADSFPSLMYMHLQDPPPLPSSRGAPRWADAPIFAALAKDKAERPTSAGAFVASLRRSMAQASSLDGTLPAGSSVAATDLSAMQPPPIAVASVGLESKPGDYFAAPGKTLPPQSPRRVGRTIALVAGLAVAVGTGVYVLRDRGAEEKSSASVASGSAAPAPSTSDRAVEAKLAAARSASGRDDWTQTLALSNQVLALVPDHPDATLLAAKANDELIAAPKYERFKESLAAQQVETAVRALRTIPSTSVYRARAAKELDVAAAPWLEQQVAAVAAAAGRKRCAEIAALRARVQDSFPDRADVLARIDAEALDCKGMRRPTAGRGSATSQPTNAGKGSATTQPTSGSGSASALETKPPPGDPDKVKF